MPSCTTTALSRPPLEEVFTQIPDPRDPRGVRHRLAIVLTLDQAAVTAGANGAKTLLAISEWIGDADRDSLARLGIGPEEVLPCESTIRRTLAALDADDLDARLAGPAVQGVGYRQWLRRTAREAHVDGWVRNRSNGKVEALVYGSKPDLAHVYRMVHTGPANADVSAVQTRRVSIVPRPGFPIRGEPVT